MNTATNYVCETDLTPDEIQAGERDNVLVAWRTDETGKQWFRRVPTMHGVPAVDEKLEGGADA